MALFAALIAACSADPTTSDAGPVDAEPADAGNGDDARDAAPAPDADPALEASQVASDFGTWTIPAGGEQYPCAQWTLNNEKPLYVNAVVQSNDGGWHHSNWYAVSDEKYAGPDGIFPCEERGFNEREGAILGTVVFAQSTQAYVESQKLPEGVVIKIPPHSKIMGGAHLLNIATTPLETGVRIGLELVHPRDVKTIAMPWRLDNSQLRIPPGEEIRFDTTCDLNGAYELSADEPFAPKIFWILPHYHGIGNYFRVDAVRPEGDETIFEQEGFNAEANGITFDPPLDLAGATGLRFACGYENPRDRTVTYGLEGDDEMCTLLAFTDAALRLNTEVFETQGIETVDGIETRYGKCASIFLRNSADQNMPTQEEIDAPLYVPEGSEISGGGGVIPDCEDTPLDAEPDGPITLSSLRVDVFRVGCSFNSCHDSTAPAGGLDLTAADLHAELLGHELLTDAGMPLVTPTDPEQSWLYRVMSSCEPQTATGTTTAFMPRNSPKLLAPGKVARLRAWLEAGAKDD